MQSIRVTITAALMALATAAAAAPSPTQKCEAGKNLAAGKYALCRQKAKKKLVLTGDGTKYLQNLGKCDQKYSSKWQAVEIQGAGMCPTAADEAAMKAFIGQHSMTVATALSGTGLPQCGDSAVNAGEQCDGVDLGGATCASLGFGSGTLACTLGCQFDKSGCTGAEPPPLASGQTTCYDGSGNVISCAGTGQDGELQKGVTRSFTDNGDGTITDDVTGLMWEKLSDDGSIHDWNDSYTWANAFTKVANLNTAVFAGHTDWRLPNVNELQTLTNYGAVNPAVYGPFNTGCVPSCTVTTCSCTQSFFYWSSTTYQLDPSFAWFVNFYGGFVVADFKSYGLYVRAVRGGS